MRQLKRIIGFIILFLILTPTYSWGGDARGIGVGPTYIMLNSALRGSTYKQTIYVYNQNKYDSTIFLNATGEAGKWVTFYETSNLSKPVTSTFVPKMSSRNIILKITIPDDVANKQYNGSVIVSSEPADTNVSGNYSTVSLNIPVLLSINVTGDQNLNVSLWYVEVDNVEINEPCKLRLQFKNTGNVIADPHTEVVITKDGRYIDSLSGTAEPIQPGQLGTQELIWNTTGMVAGDYVAHFNITVDGKPVEERDVSFKLLPLGTFTRNGTLLGITYEGKPEKGKVLKIIATFKNTGDVDTTAKFIGEVYKNGELLEVVESREITVPKYNKENLYAYYKIQENGTYTVKGYVVYGGKKTNTTEMMFTVGGSKGKTFDVLTIALVVGMVGAAATGLLLWRKRRRRKVIRIKVPLSFRIATAFEKMKNIFSKAFSSIDSKPLTSREDWENNRAKRKGEKKRLKEQRRRERRERREQRMKAREERKKQKEKQGRVDNSLKNKR